MPGFNIAGLLPANLKHYFHYNGSLTTPACYQTVKWTVFNQTMLLSRGQVRQGDDLHAGSCPGSPCKHTPCVLVPWGSPGSQRWDGMHPALLMPFSFQMSRLLMSLRNDDSKALQNNYRLAQDLHGRRVLASFQTTLSSGDDTRAGKERVSMLRLHPAAGVQRRSEEQESRLRVSYRNAAFSWVRPARQVTYGSTGLGVLLSSISALLSPCLGKMGF